MWRGCCGPVGLGERGCCGVRQSLTPWVSGSGRCPRGRGGVSSLGGVGGGGREGGTGPLHPIALPCSPYSPPSTHSSCPLHSIQPTCHPGPPSLCPTFTSPPPCPPPIVPTVPPTPHSPPHASQCPAAHHKHSSREPLCPPWIPKPPPARLPGAPVFPHPAPVPLSGVLYPSPAPLSGVPSPPYPSPALPAHSPGVPAGAVPPVEGYDGVTADPSPTDSTAGPRQQPLRDPQRCPMAGAPSPTPGHPHAHGPGQSWPHSRAFPAPWPGAPFPRDWGHPPPPVWAPPLDTARPPPGQTTPALVGGGGSLTWCRQGQLQRGDPASVPHGRAHQQSCSPPPSSTLQLCPRAATALPDPIAPITHPTAHPVASHSPTREPTAPP